MADEPRGGWKPGPLPPETWLWGGVVPVGCEGPWFYFADFCGDHVVVYPGHRALKPEEVAWYNNALDLPPECTHRAKE